MVGENRIYGAKVGTVDYTPYPKRCESGGWRERCCPSFTQRPLFKFFGNEKRAD